MLNHIPTPAQFLPTIPPRSRNSANGIEVSVHTCYYRARMVGRASNPPWGQTPRPISPFPIIPSRHSRDNGNPGKGVTRARAAGHRPPATNHCPALPRRATLMRRIAHSDITESNRTTDTPSYEMSNMVQKGAETNRIRRSAKPVPVETACGSNGIGPVCGVRLSGCRLTAPRRDNYDCHCPASWQNHDRRG